MITLKNEFMTCFFDEANGQLSQIRRANLLLPFDGFAFDFGCNETMAIGMLEYDSMLEFRTWNLPDIRPTRKSFDCKPVRIISDKSSLEVRYELETTQVTVQYALCSRCLSAKISIYNRTEQALYLNGCAFLPALALTDGVTFDYPANTPCGSFSISEQNLYAPVQSGLVNFAIHSALADGDLNILFLNKIEKWSCGVYREESATRYAFHAGLEIDLAPHSSCEVGTLFLMPCAKACDDFPGDGNPYLQIREQVAALGYVPCANGIHDGIMYSCHPSGTMDSNFPLKTDLFEYANYLPVLKKMGIDHVWLLPVFDHNENGVYHSNDQSIIDERYGGERGCRFFADRAHELGMTILFDYVPHGPAPEFPLAKDHPEWPSKRRDGSLQDEWECVSMDYNHPGYQEYTSHLVYDHVRRFGVDGARIDCAMGGLSNWRPYPGNRPSGNSVLAGVHITEAIQKGFLSGGKPSFLLPENFNPLPNYYHCTDLFYGMNLYRAFVELEPLLASQPARYVSALTDFLEREALVTPPDYHKLRFLGNHDTVSWVWQSARAVHCYGTAAAKALFALISFIDGIPMIYQGDEDPEIYGGNGENLVEYFTMLFHHRKTFLPKGSNSTFYLRTNTPVMAFLREADNAAKENSSQENPSAPYETKGDGDVLVLINLSADAQSFDFAKLDGRAVFLAESEKSSSDEKMPPYGYKLFRVSESKR